MEKRRNARRRRESINFLNSKEIKELNKNLEESYGIKVPKEFAYVRIKKNKIHIINRDVEKLNLDSLKSDRMGMYLCTEDKIGIRLSIEGSQMFSHKIKNKIEISARQEKEWIFGKDLELSEDQLSDKESGTIYVVHHNNDFCGSGFLKGNVLKNFVPKERRISSLD